MEIRFNTPYNYSSRPCGRVVDVVTVDVVDTSVDNVRNNISVGAADASKPFYTNSDVPVSLFGPGLTATHYDPNRHRGIFAPKDAAAGSAAASIPSPSAANAANNAAAAAVPSANASTVQNS